MKQQFNYNSFFWNFGTTSFRTKHLNFSIEKQLELLDSFWKFNPEKEWDKNTQIDYYKFLQKEKFLKGNDPKKDKSAREKTSGLVDIGLISPKRKITEVGKALLNLSQKGTYKSDNLLSIPADSLIYLSQLIKYSIPLKDGYVRPFLVLLYLLSEIGPLSNDEFTYLAPLCISVESTASIVKSITELRKGNISLDEIIYNHIMSQQNYKDAHFAWMNAKVTEELVMAIGINRKSRDYDKIYYTLYIALKKLFLENDDSAAIDIYNITKKIQIGSYWRNLLFDTASLKAIKNAPRIHLRNSDFKFGTTEEEFKEAFFKYLHLFKVRSTLHDYFDLNRRYIKLSNIILFEEAQLKYDIVPKPLFNSAMPELYKLAYTEATNLEQLTSLETICPTLRIDDRQLLTALNKELGTNLESIEEVYSEVQYQRYERFNKMIKERFSDNQLIELLKNFDDRNDEAISKAVTDNADIPTIFEYILGIIWYKTSEFKGRILNYLKLSLDADLLPVTHAAGGEADIVYEYEESSPYYPKHNLLLEATLADGTNQRRLEMEPVSRHLGRPLLRTHNTNNYCIFVTTYLDVNVISDFHNRKHFHYYDTQNKEDFIRGMKIIPLDTSDLREIIRQGKKYQELYQIFERAYQQSDQYHPKKWYEKMVKILPGSN